MRAKDLFLAASRTKVSYIYRSHLDGGGEADASFDELRDVLERFAVDPRLSHDHCEKVSQRAGG